MKREPEMPEALLDPDDVCRLLKIERPSLNRLVREGHLPAPAVKLGALRRWRREQIPALNA